jgi:hypothetical protein
MKNLKDYLTESKKTYSFRIKVAGPLSEGFAEKVKSCLGKYDCVKFDKSAETPITKTAFEFPELANIEVTVFEAECNYPVTPHEITTMIKTSTGLNDTHLRVRNVNEPFEFDQALLNATTKRTTALLSDSEYKEAGKIKAKDYFGDEFNKSFLKDLDKTAKERKKTQGDYKMPKQKEDKSGTKSALGS